MTTPAPWVQRLPEPAARETTATSPAAKAALPSAVASGSWSAVASMTSPGSTSVMLVLAGRRFCERPIRPCLSRSRMRSC